MRDGLSYARLGALFGVPAARVSVATQREGWGRKVNGQEPEEVVSVTSSSDLKRKIDRRQVRGAASSPRRNRPRESHLPPRWWRRGGTMGAEL